MNKYIVLTPSWPSSPHTEPQSLDPINRPFGTSTTLSLINTLRTLLQLELHLHISALLTSSPLLYTLGSLHRPALAHTEPQTLHSAKTYTTCSDSSTAQAISKPQLFHHSATHFHPLWSFDHPAPNYYTQYFPPLAPRPDPGRGQGQGGTE